MAKKNSITSFYHFTFLAIDIHSGEDALFGAMKALVNNHVTFTYSKIRNDICIDDGYDIDEIKDILSPFAPYKLEEEGLPF